MLSTFVMPSILSAWNLVRVRLIFPILRIKERLQGQTARRSSRSLSDPSSSHQTTHQSSKRKGGDRDSNAHMMASSRLPVSLQNMLVSVGKLYNSLAPALQISIPACTLIYYTWKLPGSLPFAARHRYATDFSSDPNGVDMQNMEPPDWSEVMFVASFPTVASLLCFR